MCRETGKIRQVLDQEATAQSPAPSLQPNSNTEDHSRSATKLLLRYVSRDAGKGHLHSLSSVGSHGVSLDWTKGYPQGIHAVHLRLHHDGSATDTTGRTADSPDGRPTDHRWVSKNRRGDFGGSPPRCTTGPRRQHYLYPMHHRPIPDGVADASCSTRRSAAAARYLFPIGLNRFSVSSFPSTLVPQ